MGPSPCVDNFPLLDASRCLVDAMDLASSASSHTSHPPLRFTDAIGTSVLSSPGPGPLPCKRLGLVAASPTQASVKTGSPPHPAICTYDDAFANGPGPDAAIRGDLEKYGPFRGYL